jgi:hypothetical protein
VHRNNERLHLTVNVELLEPLMWGMEPVIHQTEGRTRCGQEVRDEQRTPGVIEPEEDG